MPSSIIGEDLTIEGDIRSDEGSVDIKGRVVGDVSAEVITVQLSGSVDGAISATKIAIEGIHTGSLKCDDLKLASSHGLRLMSWLRLWQRKVGPKLKARLISQDGNRTIPVSRRARDTFELMQF